ncbi:hypothetical protein BDZ94DRAFT_408334 [Collybia nuda]|uniref:Uncharacterized protein n=1 Tax=Collybia nuda TaxID=64659 RepID=A0A9P6CK93_9AGAR|nr:hypothetical protein BDZ94DRAFT_408334 [Collybia nuda]
MDHIVRCALYRWAWSFRGHLVSAPFKFRQPRVPCVLFVPPTMCGRDCNKTPTRILEFLVWPARLPVQATDVCLAQRRYWIRHHIIWDNTKKYGSHIHWTQVCAESLHVCPLSDAAVASIFLGGQSLIKLDARYTTRWTCGSLAKPLNQPLLTFAPD